MTCQCIFCIDMSYTNFMKIFLGIIFGCITAVLCWQACRVAAFLEKAEQDFQCNGCIKKESCFGKCIIKVFRSSYTMIEEFMLVSFWKVRSYCRYIQKADFRRLWSYLIACNIVMVSFFWSGDVSLVTILYAVVIMMLCILSVIDWKTQYIPLECSIIIFICGLIHLFADFSNWLEYLIGLIAVSGFLYIVNWCLTPVLRKKYEGVQEIDSVIGDGDIKLMAATGLLLGWKLNFFALGIGCIAGSVIHLVLMKIKESERQFALGPYLSLGVYITMICGEQLVGWYLNMVGFVP